MHHMQRNRMVRRHDLPAMQGNRSMAHSPIGKAETTARLTTQQKGDAELLSAAALEEVIPRTVERAFDPSECGQGREILSGLKALPLPRAKPCLVGHLLLCGSHTNPHSGDVTSETCPLSAGHWLFRWHTRIVSKTKRTKHKALPRHVRGRIPVNIQQISTAEGLIALRQ